MTTLSKQNLKMCLLQKTKYKGTQLYIQQLLKFNHEIYQIINSVLVEILIDSKGNYLAKLHTLKFYQEILLTANFDFVDEVDEVIQQYLTYIAEYNKNNKEISRGANYFVEIQKIEKDANILKIGSSYVLLATQIIYFFAKYYPIDSQGDSTRFAEYYAEMKKQGVPFPENNQYNFFKADDPKKFEANLKNYQKKLQKEKGKEYKGEKVEKKEEKIAIKSQIQKQNIHITQSKGKLSANKIIDQNENRNDQAISMLNKLKEQPQLYSKQLYQKIQNQCLQAKQGLQLKNIEIEKIHEKYKIQKQQLLLKIQQSEAKSIKIDGELKQKQLIIIQMQKEISELKASRQNKTSECEPQNMEIIIHGPPQYSHLESQNETLKSQIEAFHSIENEYNKLIVEIAQANKSIQILTSTNHDLTVQIKSYQQQIKTLSQPKQQNVNQISDQAKRNSDGLIICDQTSYNNLKQLKQVLQLNYHRESINDHIVNSTKQQVNRNIVQANTLKYSMSEFLKKQMILDHRQDEKTFIGQKLNEQEAKQNKKSQSFSRKGRSIGKTEHSNSKLKANTFYKQNNHHASVTGLKAFAKPLKLTSNLHKTTQGFFQKHPAESVKMCTVFPFLQNYFPVTYQQNFDFRYICLQKLNQTIPIFQNQSIEVSISKFTQEKCILGVINLGDKQKKIKLISNCDNFANEKQSSKRVQSLQKVQFTLNIKEIDLNLRYPTISIITGNQAISITRGTSQNNIFHIKLPITLLNFCEFNHNVSMDAFRSSQRMIKYQSPKIVLSSLYSSIKHCFSQLKFEKDQNQWIFNGFLQFKYLPQCELILEIAQISRLVTFTAYFKQSSKYSQNFAKVILQVLMYLVHG